MEMKLELCVVTNSDCELVPEGRFGVLEASGNYLGDFDTVWEAEEFIKLELGE